MRRKRKHAEAANHERWLISYADFITLLFAFFVVMYSTAQVDKARVGKLALAVQVAFDELGVFPGSIAVPAANPERTELVKPPAVDESVDLGTLRRELEKSLAGEITRHEVDIHSVPDGLVISLREIGFFGSGSAALEAHSLPAFGRIAKLLAERTYRVRIEGHTDNVPIHNARFTSNWELSTARATELVQLLVTRFGINPARLSAAGYAQYHPVAANDSADGRAQNRRVDLVVLGRKVTAPGMGDAAVPAQ